jgi:hypothetical protein
MKVHPSTVVVPLAAVLLIVGAGAVLATSGNPTSTPVEVPAADSPSPAATTAPAATSVPAPTSAPSATDKPKPVRQDTALTDALDKLVADGTITSGQKDKILATVQAERQARLDELKAQREAIKVQREQIKGFLSDGVITQDELNQLPADSPLRSLTTLLDDGKITTDELKEIGRGFFMGGGNGRGHGFGHRFKGDQPDATATPAP